MLHRSKARSATPILALLSLAFALFALRVDAAKTVTKYRTAYATVTRTAYATVTRTVAGPTGTVTRTQTVTAACQSAAATPPASTNSATAASTPGYNGQFAQNQVALHNAKRALHGVPAVTWNETLANFALTYASGCPAGHSGSGYGENLAWGAPATSWTDEGLFNLWYNEGQGYDYSQPNFNEATGHFTQVVWKKTQQIGCALVSCPKQYRNFGADFRSLTCEYYPPGNYQGQFVANVLPPK